MGELGSGHSTRGRARHWYLPCAALALYAASCTSEPQSFDRRVRIEEVAAKPPAAPRVRDEGDPRPAPLSPSASAQIIDARQAPPSAPSEMPNSISPQDAGCCKTLDSLNRQRSSLRDSPCRKDEDCVGLPVLRQNCYNDRTRAPVRHHRAFDALHDNPKVQEYLRNVKAYELSCGSTWRAVLARCIKHRCRPAVVQGTEYTGRVWDDPHPPDVDDPYGDPYEGF